MNLCVCVYVHDFFFRRRRKGERDKEEKEKSVYKERGDDLRVEESGRHVFTGVPPPHSSPF